MSAFSQIYGAIESAKTELETLRPVMDKQRRFPASNARELAPTGMFRLLTPGSIGGPEQSPLEFFKILELIARSNASAAWCAMIASTNAISAAYLSASEAQTIFGDPNVITGGVFAPRGKAIDKEEHYLVSGRWAWGSGSANGTWLAGGCTIWEDGEMQTLSSGGPDIRMMFFPAEKAELIDTWHVMGLRGTGSGDFQVKNIKVPKSQSVSLLTDKPREPGALYKFPVFGLLALGIAGVAMGNGRSALDRLKHQAGSKTLPNGKTLATKPYIQTAVAKLEADWQSARAYIIQQVERCWRIAETQDDIPVNDRAALRLACTRGTRICADICRRVYEIGGGDSLFEGNDIERFFRDSSAMIQHIMTGAGTYEMIGRVMLDQRVNVTMI